MKKIYLIFLLLLELTISNNRTTNYKKRGCAGRSAKIAKKDCGSECEIPSDACQECIRSNMPKRCKSVPSSECYKCSKLHTETFPNCSNDANIPKCMGDIIKLIEPTCEYCVCTLSCKLYGPRTKICKQCRGEIDDVDYSAYYLHSHFLANPLCDFGWIASNDDNNQKCFRAFNTRVQFNTFDCGAFGSSLAVLDTDNKRFAAIDTAGDGSRSQYWVGAACNSKICRWLGTNETVQGPFNKNCPTNLSPSGLRMNKKGKFCNLSEEKKRGFICEQDTCEICSKDNKLCCPNDGECINGFCKLPPIEDRNKE